VVNETYEFTGDKVEAVETLVHVFEAAFSVLVSEVEESQTGISVGCLWIVDAEEGFKDSDTLHMIRDSLAHLFNLEIDVGNSRITKGNVFMDGTKDLNSQNKSSTYIQKNLNSSNQAFDSFFKFSFICQFSCLRITKTKIILQVRSVV
jgi:hypothetical protein